MQYGNRIRKSRFINSPLGIVFTLIVLLVLIRATYNIHSKKDVSRERLDKAEKELSSLTFRKQELEKNVVILSSEQGIEAELRTKFRATKPGESVAVIVSSTDSMRLQSASLLDSPEIEDVRGIIPRLLRALGL